MPFRKFANPETNLFPEIRNTFNETGKIEPLHLWAILKWKANRAALRHRERLQELHGDFSNATAKLANSLHTAQSDQLRMAALMSERFGFRLPTASAILTVLYPERFTIYDYRVCSQFPEPHDGEFAKLQHRRYSPGLWSDYEKFRQLVIEFTPEDITELRDADHYLWGRSWAKDASRDLSLPFP
ncbi:MAG: hypothetical protein K5863_00160 [Nitratireductor sp.]|uniref:hypothetical protein n=1 Tax=Nitratireductor sp. TaxID=1872084 RepID=UPI0026073916|nr:hypothetical protein [Nitratireductor sp.]MCV0348461.1 hypothetical protein [Nitratireductor sp.]